MKDVANEGGTAESTPAMGSDFERGFSGKSRDKAPTEWAGPLLMLVVRVPLILAGLVLLSGLFALTTGGGSSLAVAWSEGWSQALDHTYIVVSVFAYLGCLALLWWLMRREGRRLRDLIGFDREELGRDILVGLGVFVLMAAVFWIAPALASVVSGGAEAYSPGATSPPVWVLLYTTVALPFTLAPAEEMVYRAYALPRLATLTGRTWLAVLLTAFAFGVEHLVIPPVGDAGSWVARFLTLFAVGLLLQILYLRLGRLVPLIVGHWLIVVAFLGGLPLILALG